ncbi:hypothetical protein B0H19DRAFT_1266755 [Mycena capillaripes]|nr:hypothetical protein B0H19DRAFT_1266755 [Mycena capillaripes]
MHPDLSPQTLSQLPETVQPMTICAADGNSADLKRVLRIIADDTFLHQHKFIFVPVVYANLGPERIPSDAADVPVLAARALVILSCGMTAMHVFLPFHKLSVLEYDIYYF